MAESWRVAVMLMITAPSVGPVFFMWGRTAFDMWKTPWRSMPSTVLCVMCDVCVFVCVCV